MDEKYLQKYCRKDACLNLIATDYSYTQCYFLRMAIGTQAKRIPEL